MSWKFLIPAVLPAVLAAQFTVSSDHQYRAAFNNFMIEGKYAEAEAEARRSIAFAESASGPDSMETARCLDMLTEVYFYGDRVRSPEAEAVGLRAIAIKEKLGPSPELAISYRLFGDLLKVRGDYQRARPYFELAVNIHRTPAGYHPREEGEALVALGELLGKTGDFAAAKSAFQQALEIRQKFFPPVTLNTAATMAAYAVVLRETGEFETARQYFTQALDIIGKKLGADHLENAEVQNDLGALLIRMGNPAEAVPLLAQTLATEEKAYGPDHVDLAFVLNNLGSAHAALGDLMDAKAEYERAIRIATGVYGPDHPDLARFLSGYASVLARLGERTQAFEAAARTEEIGREHLALTIRSFPERQALLFAATRPSGLDVMLAAALADPALRRRALDQLIRSRALVFDEMAARRRFLGADADPANARLWDEVEMARERLSRLVVQGPASFTAGGYAAALRRARQENDSAERALAEKNGAFRSQAAHHAAGLPEVSSALHAGDALVSYVRFGAEPVYAAFVLRPGREPGFFKLATAAKVEAGVAEVRKQILAEAGNPGVSPKRAETLYRVAAEALRRLVWDPLEPALAGADRVFLTPDQALNLVDFGALPARGTGYLAERGPLLHYLSPERDAILPPAAKKGSGLLALGNPAVDVVARRASGPVLTSNARIFRGAVSTCQDFGSLRFDTLPASALEVRDIAALWRAARRGDVLERIGDSASEAEFKLDAGGRQIVHVAAHAFFLGGNCPSAVNSAMGENPLLLSGIALAGANRRRSAPANAEDGIVTAEEIAALDLSGVEWAVLSGCETGIGKLLPGEGVFGLRRAFQVAGARTVIMSLWPVDDQATRTWMKTLYREHLTNGRGAAESVRAAGLATLAQRRAAGLSTHPFYWAGFIAAGDWR